MVLSAAEVRDWALVGFLQATVSGLLFQGSFLLDPATDLQLKLTHLLLELTDQIDYALGGGKDR